MSKHKGLLSDEYRVHARALHEIDPQTRGLSIERVLGTTDSSMGFMGLMNVHRIAAWSHLQDRLTRSAVS